MAEFNMDSLKPNSHAYKDNLDKNRKKPDRPALKPVVKKDSIVKVKKSLGDKFREAFISEDTKDVKSYIFLDVIVPTIKNTILDVGEMIMFGSTSGRRGSRGFRYQTRDRVSYNAYYKRDEDRDDRYDRSSKRDKNRYERSDKVDYRDIVLRDRVDAEEVVNGLRERIEKYDRATIADLYDLIDVTSSYTDANWGWEREEDIGIRRVSSGYLIDVAEARYLE